MNLLLMTTWAASAVIAPSQPSLTEAQARAMALAPIDAAPLIAANREIDICPELWERFFNCLLSGRDDCREPRCG